MRKYNDNNLIRINKTVARNMFNGNYPILVVPCKYRPTNYWMPAVEIQNDYDNTFDSIVNAYEYYNCHYNEAGYYAAYYVNKDHYDFYINN